MRPGLRAGSTGLISEESMNNTLFIVIKLPLSCKGVFKKRGNVTIIPVAFYSVKARYSTALFPL
jgi:hypothetical protein